MIKRFILQKRNIIRRIIDEISIVIKRFILSCVLSNRKVIRTITNQIQSLLFPIINYISDVIEKCMIKTNLQGKVVVLTGKCLSRPHLCGLVFNQSILFSL